MVFSQKAQKSAGTTWIRIIFCLIPALKRRKNLVPLSTKAFRWSTPRYQTQLQLDHVPSTPLIIPAVGGVGYPQRYA